MAPGAATTTTDKNDDAPTQRASIVVLLGWFGAQPRQLAKYEALYDRNTVEFISHIAPNRAIMFLNEPLLEQSARNVLQQVADRLHKHSPGIPIVFHAFSNGGGFILHIIEELLRDTNATRKTGDDNNSAVDYVRQHAGTMVQIWDSAPAYPDYQACMGSV
mmetsp:Transcript_12793/g.28124  ORF Transcript_12793/g.28124 Transcript_12793/m.28124 type:complete len:161 (-) Transcript_12793:517-999(-)|eukprot:CAMPEP_0168741528 /NCGR_PEP_ID=MMETSP0724-20121128/12564_1 /TAXON_ID=265536 /ORGANISM="Amphiprora sp., Strain CCMP467" /LENGTH=160 /DNA_ID=CAMNT_0008789043 /DNA_START=239 /DNA_END=721 /DNA_ORIENTATION=+